MRRQPPYDTECSWPGLEPGLPAPHTNTAADAYNALGVLSVHTPTEQELDQAHAPSVLGRLRELEGAIALVKSSLDNHASSYYSVASQIAELNARIGSLGVQDRLHSPRLPPAPEASPQLRTSTDAPPASAPDGPESSGPTHGADSDEDGQYSRIQGMIDALIKDAGSALNSKPRDLRLSGRPAHVPVAADCCELLSSSGPDEAHTLVGDRSTGGTPTAMSATKPHFTPLRPTHHVREFARQVPMPRPSSARGASPTVSHSWRQQLPPRPSARTVRHWAEATHDPSEADAESDSEGGLFGTPLLAPQHSRRSPLHRHRRQSSGQPGEWHAVTAHTRGRHRSDTGDSLRSNSSETCVSSGNRLSREFPSISSSLLLADHYDSRTHTAECPSDALPRHPHYGSHYDGGYSHLRSVEGRFMSPAPQPGRIRSSTHGGEISPVAHDYGPEPPLRPTAGPHLGHQRMEAATATPLPPDAPESSSGRRSPSVSLARKEELAQSGDSGLLSMFSLVYWTVLFTLGALMLDSFLCLTAGKRVMGTVDRITHTETANAPRGDQQADEDGSVDLAGAVGRFVRWYVECPEDTPSTGAQWPRPRSLRARKTLAARGSFQHIE